MYLIKRIFQFNCNHYAPYYYCKLCRKNNHINKRNRVSHIYKHHYSYFVIIYKGYFYNGKKSANNTYKKHKKIYKHTDNINYKKINLFYKFNKHYKSRLLDLNYKKINKFVLQYVLMIMRGKP